MTKLLDETEVCVTTSQGNSIRVIVREKSNPGLEGLVHPNALLVSCFPIPLSFSPLVFVEEVLSDNSPGRSVGRIVFRRHI